MGGVEELEVQTLGLLEVWVAVYLDGSVAESGVGRLGGVFGGLDSVEQL